MTKISDDSDNDDRPYLDFDQLAAQPVLGNYQWLPQQRIKTADFQQYPAAEFHRIILAPAESKCEHNDRLTTELNWKAACAPRADILNDA